MLITEYSSQIERPLRSALATRRKLTSVQRAAWALSVLLFGAATGAGAVLSAGALGVGALGCAAGAVLIGLSARRNASDIRMRMQSLAALRGIARDAGASQTEIDATDAIYLSFNTRDTIEVMRGRKSII